MTNEDYMQLFRNQVLTKYLMKCGQNFYPN